MSKPLLIPLFSLLVIVYGLFAAEAMAQKPVSPSPKIGWHWYEVKPPEKDPEEKRVIPNLSDYPMQKLWDMHPDDFQALLKNIHKKAVMTLKQDDVRDYLVIQDIARRKARAYTNVSIMTVQKYPRLSLEKDFPTVIPGRNAKIRQQMAEVKLKIDQSIDKFALVYFFSPTCHFCDEQNNILKLFQSRHPWPVKKINILKHPKLAKEMGVHAVPYLILVSKVSKETMPISAGVISVKELEKRLYRGMRLLNKETDSTSYSMYEFQRGGGFDATAPFQTSHRLAHDNGVPK